MTVQYERAREIATAPVDKVRVGRGRGGSVHMCMINECDFVNTALVCFFEIRISPPLN